MSELFQILHSFIINKQRNNFWSIIGYFQIIKQNWNFIEKLLQSIFYLWYLRQFQYVLFGSCHFRNFVFLYFGHLSYVSPENHDDLKNNKLRSTIPLMDLLPPSVSSLPLLIFKALSEIHQSFLISNFG